MPDPEKLDESWLKIVDVYYQELIKTCQDFKVDHPFTKDEFINDVKTKGFFYLMSMLMFMYEDVDRKRFTWFVRKAVEFSPERF